MHGSAQPHSSHDPHPTYRLGTEKLILKYIDVHSQSDRAEGRDVTQMVRLHWWFSRVSLWGGWAVIKDFGVFMQA